ncbi:HD domain-containing protein [Streptomyces sp. NPDC056240]|uniref:HD domain-containing protein n=1 Tax=Streptomyces sp. NPDC056240 TaxID=3345759 RepID=UPI0035E342B6
MRNPRQIPTEQVRVVRRTGRDHDPQVVGTPKDLAAAIRDVISDYEAKEPPEVVFSRDADKLECVIQNVEYKAQGYEQAPVDRQQPRTPADEDRELPPGPVVETGSLDWLRTAVGGTKMQ